MLRRLYDWTLSLAAHRRASWALGAVSFAESSVFPIPPDALLIPMALADRARIWRLVLICTVFSVLGGIAGYAIGAFLFDAIAEPVFRLYGYGTKFAEFADMYNEYGTWIVLIAGLTPFPYKVVTIASGVTGLDLVTFTLSSLLARGLRFGIEGALLWWFGPPIRRFVEQRLALVVTVGLVLLIGGFALVRLVL